MIPVRVPTVIVVLCIFTSPAPAQFTPGGIPDPSSYQGSMELQRRQAETDAQMRSQNDAMQQRLDQQYANSAGRPGGGGGRPAPSLKSKPLLPPDKNPLLGRWQMIAAKPLNLGLVGQLPGASEFVNGAFAGGCKSVFGEAGVVFTPNALNWLAEDGHEEILNKVEYRSDGNNIIVIPTDSDLPMIFGLTDHDHAVVALFGCQMRRIVAGQKPVRMGTPPPAAAVGPGSVQSGRAPAMGAGAITGGRAVISLRVGATMSGNFVPIGGAVFFVVNQDPEPILAKAGFAGPSAKDSWLAACRTNQDRCAVGARAMVANKVGDTRTDVNGNGEIGDLAAGHYFIFGHGTYQGKDMVWLRPLVVQPGYNKVAIDPSQGSTG
jgi:hypothetical protein